MRPTLPCVRSATGDAKCGSFPTPARTPRYTSVSAANCLLCFAVYYVYITLQLDNCLHLTHPSNKEPIERILKTFGKS